MEKASKYAILLRFLGVAKRAALNNECVCIRNTFINLFFLYVNLLYIYMHVCIMSVCIYTEAPQHTGLTEDVYMFDTDL